MSGPVQLLQIHPDDNVCVSAQQMTANTHVEVRGVRFMLKTDVALGAKLALRTIARGEKIVKYGEPIGSATENLEIGDYVHTHNMQSDYLPTFKAGEFLESQGDR